MPFACDGCTELRVYKSSEGLALSSKPKNMTANEIYGDCAGRRVVSCVNERGLRLSTSWNTANLAAIWICIILKIIVTGIIYLLKYVKHSEGDFCLLQLTVVERCVPFIFFILSSKIPSAWPRHHNNAPSDLIKLVSSAYTVLLVLKDQISFGILDAHINLHSVHQPVHKLQTNAHLLQVVLLFLLKAAHAVPVVKICMQLRAW